MDDFSQGTGSAISPISNSKIYTAFAIEVQQWQITRMAASHIISVHYDNQSTTGTVERRDIPAPERVLRAMRSIGICWLIGAVCILVPILHFVLVPAFFLVGLLLAYYHWSSKGEILKGEFICPTCGKPNTIGKEREQFPQYRRCTSCLLTLELKLN